MLGVQLVWLVVVALLGRLVLAARHPAAGGAGWLSRRRAPASVLHTYRVVLGSRVRAQLSYRVSFALTFSARPASG